MCTPQSANFPMVSGSKITSQLSTVSVAEPLLHRLDIVADAGGAPHVVDRVGVARVVARGALGDGGHMLESIGQLGLVERLEHAGLDLALQEGAGRHHHVIAGAAGQQLRLQHLVAESNTS
jgi:hypothetical protein